MQENKNKEEHSNIFIKGMTCSACEKIITDEVKDLQGIKDIKISVSKGIANIKHDKNLDTKQLLKTIKKAGYKASFEPIESKANYTEWFTSLLIIVVLYLIYKIFMLSGLTEFIKFDPNNINYSMAFIIGVVASMSTCLMVVGAVIISFSAKYKTKGNFYQRNVEPHISFHIGRILSFGIFGGILGLLGSFINISTTAMGWFTAAIALILLWLGLNIMGALPSISSIGITMPKVFSKKWDKLKDSDHFLAPVALGALSFFLPCGFTQSMQLFATASGSFVTGALTMGMFALGTAPVLIGLGVASNRFKNTKSGLFTKVFGIIILVFAFYTLTNGLALAGINIGMFNQKEIVISEVKDNVQIIEMDITYNGFSPNVFNIKKGVPVKWIINGKQVTGCTNEIIVPSLNIKKKITSGKNIIEFTPEKVGNINFSCWMGMVRGQFVVSDDTNAPIVKGVKTTEQESKDVNTNKDIIKETETKKETPVEKITTSATSTPIKTETSQTEEKPKEVAKVVKNETQIIRMIVDRKGFTPSTFNLKEGVPVKWIINGKEVSGCTNEIIIPSLNIEKKIYKGDNIVNFTPNKVGTIDFSCWMGMVRGKFIVSANDTLCDTKNSCDL